jgi:ribosomal protein S18 acetylase RimI-like enzyme
MSGATFRRPVEADHAAVVARMEGWWPGRRGRAFVARWWFRHATGSSWIAEDDEGVLTGFILAQPSGDDPSLGLVQAIAVSPNHRRRGIGRALVEQVAGDLRARGGRRLETISWPGDPIATRFLRGVGFVPDDGAGTMRLFGTPAYPDYEGEGEDRSRWTRDL